MKRMILTLVIVMIVTPMSLRADVSLPSVFSDNMVLQRERDVPVWGTADPDEEVTVTVAEKTATGKAGPNGHWSLRLPELAVGGPYEMVVKGKNELKRSNILVGDVWLCSGQSNMQMTVKNSMNADAEISEAKNYPEIRLLTVPTVSETKPRTDQGGTWQVCSPETIPGFSAAAYFFGRALQTELKVPVGLIHSSWGGSSCEAWINPVYLEKVPLLENLIDAGRNEKMKPNHKTGGLYYGMICPIKPYAIRGAIWYQGETNAGRAYQHRVLFPVLIQSWREEWGEGDFPFYFVQLANFMKTKEEPGESAWAELRESQMAAESLRNVRGAVIIDIGDANDIHPKNKQEVGNRLARLALVEEFGREMTAGGPRLKKMEIRGEKAILSFVDFGTGLETRGEANLRGFAVAGKDRVFHWAEAAIDGDKVVVSSPEVPEPIAVRYAWADNPVCNLYNSEGIPASPFRTDFWPGVTDYNR